MDKDLIVLGAGPGGYVAAIKAAQLGRKVTIVEKEALGGVCLNWGCIPSKALLQTAKLYADIHHARNFGIMAENINFDFPSIIKRSRDVAAKLSGGVNYLMKKNKIEIVYGTGTLEKGNKLSVVNDKGESQVLSFKDIIIATGGRPRTLPGIDIDGEAFHTSRTILENSRLPQKLLVVGGGAIGIEFAYFFSSLGTQVTVVEMLDHILPPEDTEVAVELEKIFQKRGMTIKTATKTENLQKSGKTVTATLTSASGSEKWTGDACLIAIGVTPNTDNIGLEEAGIEMERGFIKTNNYLETNIPHHYAIGDITRPPQLAHKASHEGIIAASHASGENVHPMDYDNIPACTYCQPQVASIGKTERALKEENIKFNVGKIPFSAIGKAIAIGETEGFVKVLSDQVTGEILGVHILHAEATEMISEAAVIRSHEGITESVVDTIHPHPTLSESMMEAMAIAQGTPINF